MFILIRLSFDITDLSISIQADGYVWPHGKLSHASESLEQLL